MNAAKVLDDLKRRFPNEPEYHQAVEEVLSTIEEEYNKHPEFDKANLIERLCIPDRVFQFRVTWMDDKGNIQTNMGYRVQHNNAIGPYKGGIRFHASVNLSILKFLAFEQTFKNSLTTLPMGGGKGGSDFSPRGKSNAEVMRFVQAFMLELWRHIGPETDVPAGDIGVGGREVGFMFGMYKKLAHEFTGTFTGKGREFGGSLIRPEATGFGAVYYLDAVMKHEHDTLQGKTVAVAGFGNVAWGVVQKLAELGAKAVTLSGPDGYIYDPDGITTKEKFDFMLEMRASGRNKVQDYADKFGCKFVAGDKPWGEKVDIIMPCATQNDVDLTQAKRIVANNIKYYIEVANMPTTNEALRFLMDQKNMVVAPSKAVNAGGVLVSALEMSQNSERISWTAKEVDEKLHQIMTEIHDGSAECAEKYGLGYNLVAGANMVGFQKVADAMMAQGIAW